MVSDNWQILHVCVISPAMCVCVCVCVCACVRACVCVCVCDSTVPTILCPLTIPFLSSCQPQQRDQGWPGLRPPPTLASGAAVCVCGQEDQRPWGHWEVQGDDNVACEGQFCRDHTTHVPINVLRQYLSMVFTELILVSTVSLPPPPPPPLPAI